MTTIFKKSILTLLIATMLVAGMSGFIPVQKAASDGNEDKKTDFALFTTDPTPPSLVGDTGVKCTTDKPFTIHISAATFGGATDAKLIVTFADGDSVTYPINGAFSLSQAAGSTPGVDDTITATVSGTFTSPASGIVGWVSILSEDGIPSGSGCTTI